MLVESITSNAYGDLPPPPSDVSPRRDRSRRNAPSLLDWRRAAALPPVALLCLRDGALSAARAREICLAGRLSVGGTPLATPLATPLPVGAALAVDSLPLPPPAVIQTWALHKPRKVLCTLARGPFDAPGAVLVSAYIPAPDGVDAQVRVHAAPALCPRCLHAASALCPRGVKALSIRRARGVHAVLALWPRGVHAPWALSLRCAYAALS
jgi:hypothetical protein